MCHGCDVCGYLGMLHRHGRYFRNVITLYQHIVIGVQRFKCPCCNKTYSRLPCCLIPYFVYSYDVVLFCLYKVYSLSHKASATCRLLHNINPDSFITVQSISFYKGRFLTCTHLINSFFASFDEFNYSYDAVYLICSFYALKPLLFGQFILIFPKWLVMPNNRKKKQICLHHIF